MSDDYRTDRSNLDSEECGEKIEVLELLKGIDCPRRVISINLSIECYKRPVIGDLYNALERSKIHVDNNCRIYWQNKLNSILPIFNHITLSLFLQTASNFNRRLFIVRDMTAGRRNKSKMDFGLHLYTVDKTDEEIILGVTSNKNKMFDKTEEAANSSLLLIGRYDHMPIERARSAVKDKSTASSKRDKTPKTVKKSGKSVK
ncbi:uncharacterized protein LOC111064620 isoform X2 [Nilaparvata lugens]|uniref:uncharacterized protein LOC111064620 isoform X2 n=1 Tax=Nilaparvata lugens TaxID=108931 RepID=UPI00193DA5C4|nr:uncharacterized protein LOC111064620 isoform X2 [Nilaparvata lugens]